MNAGKTRGAATPDDLGRLLFTFGVVTDGHVRPEEGDESSPWAVNLLANGRNRHVVREFNRLGPDFVVNMGDLVHPVPVLPSYGPAAEAFHAIYGALDCPLHVIPGNHDVGDKPVPWMPAGLVDQAGVEQFRRHFGPDFSSFDHGGCHFVLVDNVVCNSGIEAEAEQKAWLEADLKANAGKRTFLFMHYPPYVTDPDEPPSYDNIDEPARAWLLSLIEAHGVEALFAGHVHNFFYHRHAATDCYVLPSITFFRQDHGDIFKSAPAADSEDGRNDLGKFGVFVVRVYEGGHVTHQVRTWGATAEASEMATPAPARLAMRHPSEAGPATLGVHLRHPWAEMTELPYNGPLDEFARKRVRNDYPLAALWELGIAKTRIPLDDLAEAATRRRMTWLRDKGHRFTVFTFGAPERRAATLLGRHRDLVDAWEVVLPWQDAQDAAAAIRRLRKRTGLRTFINKLESSADKARQGSKFSHFVSHGFPVDEGDTVAAFLERHPEVADGVVFRATTEEAPLAATEAAAGLARDLGVAATLTVRLALDNPAAGNRDDDAIAGRVAEACVAALAHPDMDVFLDTFVDLDRGYFVRHGLVDRRYNPRPAGRVVGHLHAVLADGAAPLSVDEERATAGGRELVLRRGGDVYRLRLGDDGAGEDAGGGAWIDLVGGVAGPAPGPGPSLWVAD